MRPPTSRISRGQLSPALGFLNRRVEARLGSAQFPARIERVIPASIDTGGICPDYRADVTRLACPQREPRAIRPEKSPALAHALVKS